MSFQLFSKGCKSLEVDTKFYNSSLTCSHIQYKGRKFKKLHNILVEMEIKIKHWMTQDDLRLKVKL